MFVLKTKTYNMNLNYTSKKHKAIISIIGNLKLLKKILL